MEEVLLIAIQATIDAERSIRMAEAASKGNKEDATSLMIRASSDYDLELSLAIHEK